MTAIEMWAQAPVMQALGAALVHFLWQGAAIAVLLAGVLFVARKASVRYNAAACAMLLMPVVFAATFGTLWDASGDVTATPISGLRATLPEAGSAGAAPDAGSGWLEWLLARSGWAAPLWLLGVAASSMRRFASWAAAQRLKASGVFPAPSEWVDKLDELARRVGVDAPALRESVRVGSPAVVGLLKPAILVPAGFFAACPPRQVELILLHELAHIRRHDYLAAALAGLVESLFFFHPAVWWVADAMRREREHCCDDMVVAGTGDAHGYASALAGLEQMREAIPEPAMGAAQGDLLARVRRLLAPEERATPLAGASFALALAGLAATVWLSLPAPAEAQAPTGSKYENWLQSDVVYIIEERERDAFAKLSSDEERDRFIEQFWERRDPTPGTKTNEAKEEHYRRIAYSNDRWGEEAAPGWKTDRGRIYVIHGPPDEIEAHPSGGRSGAGAFDSAEPYEMWRYRSMEGVGVDIVLTFVRDPVSGRYELPEGLP